MKKINEIKGYEKVSDIYYVTTCGRIYSTYLKGFMTLEQKVNGYLGVALKQRKSYKKCLVHRIVASAFIENSENLLTVNHKNLNKTNNYVQNLEWLSHKDNIDHFFASTENKYHKKISKLTDEQVLDICYKFKNGGTYRGLAKEYDVDFNVIKRIVLGLSYKWVRRVEG